MTRPTMIKLSVLHLSNNKQNILKANNIGNSTKPNI